MVLTVLNALSVSIKKHLKWFVVLTANINNKKHMQFALKNKKVKN